MSKINKIEGNISQGVIVSEFGSISYYGLLSEMVAKVNQMITTINETVDDNTAFKEGLINDNETFKTNLTKTITDFQTAINTEITRFEKSVTDGNTAFQNDITAKQTAFENDITTKQTAFENDITTKQTSFETKINTEQTTFQTNITNIINEFKTSINTTVNDFTTDMTSKYNDLSTEFTALQTYVNTYLTSQEFINQIKTEVDTYLSTQAFKDEIKAIVIQTVSESAILSTGGTMTGNLKFTSSPNGIGLLFYDRDDNTIKVAEIQHIYSGSTGEANGLVVVANNGKILIGGQGERPLYVNTSNSSDTGKSLALSEDLALYLVKTGDTMSGNLQLNNNISLTSKKSTGEQVTLMKINESNTKEIGDTTTGTLINSSARPVLNATNMQPSDNNHLVVIGDLNGYLSKNGGTLTGALTLNNNIPIQANTVNNIKVPLLRLNSNDTVILGTNTQELNIFTSAMPIKVERPDGSYTVALNESLPKIKTFTSTGASNIELPNGWLASNCQIISVMYKDSTMTDFVQQGFKVMQIGSNFITSYDPMINLYSANNSPTGKETLTINALTTDSNAQIKVTLLNTDYIDLG